MTATAAAIVRQVRDALDGVMPPDFARAKNAWRRQYDGVCQTVRLVRMPNRLRLQWVTLTVRLDVHPCGLSPEHGLIAQFRDPPSRQGRDDRFGDNFRLDDPADVVEQKAARLRDELAMALSYLDRTFSQEGYLAAMPVGRRRPDESPPLVGSLPVLLAFERRADVASYLENAEWVPRPELWSAGWYADLELAERVLLAYRFLGTEPSARWIDMVERTMHALNGQPSKPYAALHRRVEQLLADAGSEPR